MLFQPSKLQTGPLPPLNPPPPRAPYRWYILTLAELQHSTRSRLHTRRRSQKHKREEISQRFLQPVTPLSGRCFQNVTVTLLSICVSCVPLRLRTPMFLYNFRHHKPVVSSKLKKLNSIALVRTRTITTERPPTVGEVSANICG